ncbi:MAG: hypothetical protein GY713_22390, partial [Actinomycetia bacterium]|nr:hypothetical protein [Actinomycetes bacterium]
MEALFLGEVLEPAALGRMTGDAVEQGGQDLGAGQAHVVVGLVDHHLLQHQLVSRHPGHPSGQTLDPFVELSSIRNAAEILLGEHTPFSLANYVAGPNAVLPTGGTARIYSTVSV